MNKIQKFLFCTLLGFSVFTNANSDTGHVKNIFVFKSSYGFSLKEGFINGYNTHKCGNNERSWAVIPLENNKHSQEMYSAILTAFASGKQVKINITGCIGDRFEVSGVYLINE